MNRNLSVLETQHHVVPTIIIDAGDDAATRFIEFFTAHIRNANTRQAYGRAVGDFFVWMERSEIGALGAIEPVHVATWVEHLGRRYAVPTVKQHLAAVRMLFDWLVIGQAVRHNPATAVRGPKHVVRKGKTPVLGAEEARMLLDRIPDELNGRPPRPGLDRSYGLQLRPDRRGPGHAGRGRFPPAPPAVGAAARKRRQASRDALPPQSGALSARLYRRHRDRPATRKGPLFRTIDRGPDRFSERPLPHQNAWDMVRRRARQAGIRTRINNHTFRATGITTYLKNGGSSRKPPIWPRIHRRAPRSSTTAGAMRFPSMRSSGLSSKRDAEAPFS